MILYHTYSMFNKYKIVGNFVWGQDYTNGITGITEDVECLLILVSKNNDHIYCVLRET